MENGVKESVRSDNRGIKTRGRHRCLSDKGPGMTADHVISRKH